MKFFFFWSFLRRKKPLQDERVKRERNNGVAAVLMLTQFKASVMKRGFSLILLIRNADVSGCYALEQGTCPGLNTYKQSLSLSVIAVFMVRTVCVCVCMLGGKHVVVDDMHTHTPTQSDLCSSTHLFHLCILIEVSWKIYPPALSQSHTLTHMHRHSLVQPLEPVLISSWEIHFSQLPSLFSFPRLFTSLNVHTIHIDIDACISIHNHTHIKMGHIKLIVFVFCIFLPNTNLIFFLNKQID